MPRAASGQLSRAHPLDVRGMLSGTRVVMALKTPCLSKPGSTPGRAGVKDAHLADEHSCDVRRDRRHRKLPTARFNTGNTVPSQQGTATRGWVSLRFSIPVAGTE